MFGIKFIKLRPTDYVFLYKKGKIKKQGTGLSFFYYAPDSNVVVIPIESNDTPFIFNETTIDFQEINIQGQITYKVSDPVKLAGALDFTVDSNARYTGEGKEKLPLRLINTVQITMRERLKSLNLKEALKSSSDLVEYVKQKLKNSEILSALGLELLDFSILKISPTPDMSRALEASARESLLKESDEAIYARRNFAVEQERIIKENELQTQISMEEKKRKIREEQMNAEISVQEKQKLVEDAKMETQRMVESKKSLIDSERLNSLINMEEKRKDLIKMQSENLINQSKAKAESIKLELNSISGINPEILEVLIENQMNSKQVIGKAIKNLTKNASRIGQLNISPELLASLIQNESSKEK